MREQCPIAVVEEEPLLRRGLERSLGQAFAVAALGRLGDLLLEASPQYCLVIVGLGGGNGGFEPLRTLRAAGAWQPKLLVITDGFDREAIVELMRYKPDGCLARTDALVTIVDDVKDVLAGGHPLSAPIAKVLIEVAADMAATVMVRNPHLTVLSARELEVLAKLDTGEVSNHELARSLGIGLTTLATHIAHIYDKLGVRNRPDARGEALAKAKRLGILRAPGSRPVMRIVGQ